MTTRTTTLLTITAALILTAGAIPAHAGGYVGVGVSNHGVSVGVGGSNWGLWGSSWGSSSWSVGFSTSLSGYGEWIQVSGLGNVWRPWVAAGWQPYSHGRWVWTSLGWTWVAYEPWGWIPHHYGNWAYSTVGWVWTPGYTYHPGNVVWVSSGAYLGWYPCAPAGWSHGHRAYRHGWNNGYAWGRHDGYRQGYDDGWRDARYATWVPRNQVTADNVAGHRVGHEVATRSVARSRVTPLPSGPSKTQVEGMIGRSVPTTAIAERTARIDGRETRVVRPEGQRTVVERHGGETVRTALTPTARHRVAERSTSATSSSKTGGSQARIDSGSVYRGTTNGRDRAIGISQNSGGESKRETGRTTTSVSRSASSGRTISAGNRGPASSSSQTRSVQRSGRQPSTHQVQAPAATVKRSTTSTATQSTSTDRASSSRSRSRESVEPRRTENDEKAKAGVRPSRKPAEASAEKNKRSRRTRG